MAPSEGFCEGFSYKGVAGLKKPARDGSQEVLPACKPQTARGQSGHQNPARHVAIEEAGDRGSPYWSRE